MLTFIRGEHDMTTKLYDTELFEAATKAWSEQTDASWSSDGLMAAVMAVRDAVEAAVPAQRKPIGWMPWHPEKGWDIGAICSSEWNAKTIIEHTHNANSKDGGWLAKPVYGVPAERATDSGSLALAAELISIAEEIELAAAVRTVHRAGRQLPVGAPKKIAESLRFRADAILSGRSPAAADRAERASDSGFEAGYRAAIRTVMGMINDADSLEGLRQALAASRLPAESAVKPGVVERMSIINDAPTSVTLGPVDLQRSHRLSQPVTGGYRTCPADGDKCLCDDTEALGCFNAPGSRLPPTEEPRG